jgi:hypothetical protein
MAAVIPTAIRSGAFAMRMIPNKTILHEGKEITLDQLPTKLFSCVEIASADMDLYRELCRRDFFPKHSVMGGVVTMQLLRGEPKSEAA